MQNFMQIPLRSFFRQMDEIYAKFFLYIDPLKDFYAQYVKRRGSAQGSAF